MRRRESIKRRSDGYWRQSVGPSLPLFVIDWNIENRKEEAPWSCDIWRRMRGEWEVGLAGMVVMMGAPQTTEAETSELSWSILGLEGSSAGRAEKHQSVATWSC